MNSLPHSKTRLEWCYDDSLNEEFYCLIIKQRKDLDEKEKIRCIHNNNITKFFHYEALRGIKKVIVYINPYGRWDIDLALTYEEFGK